jgi:short-subunit dehydrogenase
MVEPLGGTVLVTGASSGIGVAFARGFARTADRLVLVARRLDRLERLAAELGAAYPRLVVELWPCDLADGAALEALALRAAAADIDILVNNAGLGDQNFVEDSKWPRMAELIAVNVVAPTRLCQALVPGMVARGRGGVLNVSSGFGITYLPGFATYVGTKHYMTGFTDTLRAELSGTGVRVTQVLPGPVATEFHGVAQGTVPVHPPGFATVSAEVCAERAITTFARGGAWTVPGAVYGLASWGARLLPRWLWRGITAGFARYLRPRRQRGA